MAYIVPSDITRLALAGCRKAELATLARLKRELSDHYTVFHGVHWTRAYKGHTLFGEIDFVVVNRSGDVLVVEQKNGSLEETDGQLLKRYEDGPKSVPDQIRRSVENVRGKFQWQVGREPPLRIDYLLYCPDHRVRRIIAAGLDANRIVDAASASRLADRIEEILGPGVDVPSQRHATIEGFFRQTFELVPDVHAHISAGEEAFTRLSGGLAGILENLEMKPLRLRVSGVPGSGKTIVAQRFYERAVKTGRRPLLVCFNRPLAEKLKSICPAGGMVQTWYGLCAQLLEARGHKIDYAKVRDEGFWTDIQEAVVTEKIPEEWRFDTLIVDEGQDFEQEWVEILRLFARDEPDILWLEDADQSIRGTRPVRLDGFVTYYARANHRSPESIARFMERTLPFRFECANDLPGLGVGISTYTDADAQSTIVGKLVGDLMKKKFSASDIAVLTVRGFNNSALSKCERVGNYTLRRFTGEYDLLGNQLMTQGQILFDSIHRFKGQEAPAVIVADIDPDKAQFERWQRVLYSAMTRATVRLELLVNEANRLNDALRAA